MLQIILLSLTIVFIIANIHVGIISIRDYEHWKLALFNFSVALGLMFTLIQAI